MQKTEDLGGTVKLVWPCVILTFCTAKLALDSGTRTYVVE